MKAKDIELILIEGLYQTHETRIDFYLSKAKENNCTPDNFCLALYEAYKRLEKYVNSFDYSTWETDETTGKKAYIKETINLHYFTNGKHRGTLDNENIIALLTSLAEMTKQLMQSEKNKTPIKTDEAEKPAKTGFQSSLIDGQIQSLFDQSKGKYIDISTNPDHFKAIFKNEPLPAGFIPIKRVKKFTNTLLAYFVFELFYKENQTDYWHIATNCFDKAKHLKQSLNNTIQYNPDNKPKGYKEIDTILKNIYTPLQ